MSLMTWSSSHHGTAECHLPVAEDDIKLLIWDLPRKDQSLGRKITLESTYHRGGTVICPYKNRHVF